MGQHHDCEVHFFAKGETTQCECSVCATKKAPPEKKELPQSGKSAELAEADLIASGQLSTLANYVADP